MALSYSWYCFLLSTDKYLPHTVLDWKVIDPQANTLSLANFWLLLITGGEGICNSPILGDVLCKQSLIVTMIMSSLLMLLLSLMLSLQFILLLLSFLLIPFKANFCSGTKIPICDQCENEIDNYHLFKCIREIHNSSLPRGPAVSWTEPFLRSFFSMYVLYHGFITLTYVLYEESKPKCIMLLSYFETYGIELRARLLKIILGFWKYIQAKICFGRCAKIYFMKI